MSLRLLLLPTLLTLCLSLPPVARAQSVVLLNDLKPKRGLTLDEEATLELSDGKLQLIINNQYLKGGANARFSDKIQRKYTGPDEQEAQFLESARSINFSLGSNPPGAPQESGGQLKGKTLEGKRIDGKWTFKLPGKQEPTEAEKRALKQFEGFTQVVDAFAYLYGPERRKVGEAWKPDFSGLAAAIPGLAVAVECRIDSIEKVDHQDCARIAVAAAAQGKVAGNQIDVKFTGTILRALKDQVDLDTDFTGAIQFKGGLPGKDPNAQPNDAIVEAPLKYKRVVTVVKR